MPEIRILPDDAEFRAFIDGRIGKNTFTKFHTFHNVEKSWTNSRKWEIEEVCVYYKRYYIQGSNPIQYTSWEIIKTGFTSRKAAEIFLKLMS
jgi:hypothetical protein